MKKIFFILFLVFFNSNYGFAESYYFKNCKISNVVSGSYTINIKKNTIEVELKSADGNIQNFSDAIKTIEKDKIISQKIKSGKGEDMYYQYFLNSKTKTVDKIEYKKESGSDINVYNLFGTKKSFCLDVKTDWDKKKIDKEVLSREQQQILEAQEKIRKEQSTLIQCQGNDFTIWTNCKGSYKSNTGHKYNGLFKDGKIVKGMSLYPGGARYVGEFKNYKPHGYGTFVWANGDKYYGGWINGKSNGNGTKTWMNGQKYLGTFKDDKLHGKGTMFYPDGKKYAGEFINGKRHGEGTFSYPDGTAYIGKFIDGKEKGVGVCVSEDGKSIQCASKTDTQVDDFSGRDVKNISLAARKRVKLSQYEANSGKGKKIMDKLNTDFKEEASEICGLDKSYKILDKKIEVLEIDDTPSYGLETVVRLGITGVVECN